MSRNSVKKVLVLEAQKREVKKFWDSATACRDA
jgi:hypothetical protein